MPHASDLRAPMLCSVLRHGGGDCTNGGVTSAAQCPTGYITLLPEDASVPDKGGPFLRVVMGPGGVGPIAHPADESLGANKAGPMFGGNWVWASDSRWPFPGPIRVHDRFESWEDYDRMSR